MSRQTFRSAALPLVLIVCTALAALPAAAAGRAPARSALQASLWDQSLGWLQQLAGLTAVRAEQGSGIDPNGGHAATHSPLAPTPGGGWTVLWAKQGPGIDPSGTPAVAGLATTDSSSVQGAIGRR